MIVNKDLNLKLMCKILFTRLGYNTHYEIKLRNKSYITSYKSHDISDIDVFGYRFNSDLTNFTVGSECKSGENFALDEFYKFLGISNSYKLTKAYLIKTKIHQNARQVAVNNNFMCLTEAELRKMLLGFDVKIEKAMAIEHAKYSKQNKYFASNKLKYEKLLSYVTLDFWNRETWKNIHNIQHLLSHPIQNELLSETTLQEKYFHYYILELFSYSILKLINESIIINYSDFEGAFVSSLYGGAEALNEKRRIHDEVNIATKGVEPFERIWEADLKLLCSNMSQATFAAAKIPALIQSIYENCFYEDKLVIDKKSIGQFPFPDLTRKFLQDIMQYFVKHFNINPAIYEDFMKL